MSVSLVEDDPVARNPIGGNSHPVNQQGNQQDGQDVWDRLMVPCSQDQEGEINEHGGSERGQSGQ